MPISNNLMASVQSSFERDSVADLITNEMIHIEQNLQLKTKKQQSLQQDQHKYQRQSNKLVSSNTLQKIQNKFSTKVMTKINMKNSKFDTKNLQKLSIIESQDKTESDDFKEKEEEIKRPALNSETVYELVKSYLLKQNMVLEGPLAVYTPEEIKVNDTKSLKSKKTGPQPVLINIETLATILKDDLEIRNFHHNKVMEALRKKLEKEQLMKRISEQPDHNSIKIRYRLLFEKFLIMLMSKKVEKQFIDKQDLENYQEPENEEQQALNKIYARHTNVLKPKKLIIIPPEQEQTLVKKPEGKLIVGNQSYEMMKKLVDSYQNEELKIQNKLVRRLRNIFLGKIEKGLGKVRLAGLIKPKFWTLDAKVVEWESDDSDEIYESMTDSSFSDDEEEEKLILLESNKKIQSEKKSSSLSISSIKTQEAWLNTQQKPKKKIKLTDKLRRKLSIDVQDHLKDASKIIHVIDVEKNPQHKQLELLKEEGEKQNFYAVIKQIFNQSGSLAHKLQKEKSNSVYHYLDKCIRQKIIPMPTFAKIEGRKFFLQDIWISEDMAQALEAYFEHSEEDIRIVLLLNNGLKDAGLAKILRGFGNKTIQKFVCQGNEIGLQSVIELKKLFNNNMQELELVDTKFQDKILENQGLEILSLGRLKSLTFKGINISYPATLNKIKLYIETDNVFLRQLDLSSAYLSAQDLMQLLDLINDFKRTLLSLNLSINANESFLRSQTKTDCPELNKFVAKLASYIEQNNYLNHLNISGMHLGDALVELIPPIRSSTSLSVVHMSNNSISTECKQLIFNMMNLSMKEAKQTMETNLNNLKQPDNFQLNSSAQAKIINHQLIKKNKEAINQNNYGRSNIVFVNDAFILHRYTGHPEFTSPLNLDFNSILYGIQQQSQASRWKISLKEECWICEKWNYVMVFFSTTKCEKQMELINSSSKFYKNLKANVFLDKKTKFDYDAGGSELEMMREEQDLTKPLISGTLTDWKVHEMIPIETLLAKFEKIRELRKSNMGGHTTQLYREHFMERKKFERSKNYTRKSMEQEFQILLLEELRRQIPCANEAIVLNWPDENHLKNLTTGDYFVWTGYVKPGNHSCIIKRPRKIRISSRLSARSASCSSDSLSEDIIFYGKNDLFKRNFLVSLRKEDVECANNITIDEIEVKNPPQSSSSKRSPSILNLNVPQQTKVPTSTPKSLIQDFSKHLQNDHISQNKNHLKVVPGSPRSQLSSEAKNIWRKSDFVFAQWRLEDNTLAKQALYLDKKFSHVKKILAGCHENEEARILQLLQTYFLQLQEVFIDRASQSSVYPRIDLKQVQIMVSEWQIPGICQTTAEKIFIISNLSSNEFESDSDLKDRKQEESQADLTSQQSMASSSSMSCAHGSIQSFQHQPIPNIQLESKSIQQKQIVIEEEILEQVENLDNLSTPKNLCTSNHKKRFSVIFDPKIAKNFEKQKTNIIPSKKNQAQPMEYKLTQRISFRQKIDKTEKAAVHANNQRNQLVRFEFFDFLILLSLTHAFDIVTQRNLERSNKKTVAKLSTEIEIDLQQTNVGVYKKDLKVAEALRDIIQNHILPNNVFTMRGLSFRQNQLWTLEVNKLFAPKVDWLAKLFFNHLERVNAKKIFTMHSAKKIFDQLQSFSLSEEKILVDHKGDPVTATSSSKHPIGGYAYSLVIKDEVVKYCFGMSKMLVVDDNTNNKQYFKLKFVEFLEFFARIAAKAQLQLAFKNPAMQKKKPKSKDETDQSIDEQVDETQNLHQLGYLQNIRRRLIPSLDASQKSKNQEFTQQKSMLPNEIPLPDAIQALLLFMQAKFNN